MDPEFKEYLDVWFARLERGLDNLMTLRAAVPSPAISDKAGCVTESAPASSGTSELVTASVGLAAPPATVPISEVSLVVAPAASSDIISLVPSTCSMKCLEPMDGLFDKAHDAIADVMEHKDAHEPAIPLTVNPSTWYDQFSCAFLDASHCPEYFVNGVHMHVSAICSVRRLLLIGSVTSVPFLNLAKFFVRPKKQHGELLYTSGLYLAKFSGMFREFLQGCEGFQGTNAWYINYHLRPWLQFECNQDGMPSVSHMIQSWLSLSARPKFCTHSLGNKHMVSVKLWAHPSGDPICKLLSLGYQDFSLFLAFHLFDTAAGHEPHILLQSYGAEIYQLLTQPGEYLNLWLQPKPPWLSILTKSDTEIEERGAHPHEKEIKYVQLMLFRLLLRRTYSELPISRGMEAAALFSKNINFQPESMYVDRLLLQRYKFFPTWKLFELRLLNNILLHDWHVSWFIAHITQCGFELLQWKIAWSRQWECSEILVWSVFITRFRPPESYPLLDDMKHNNSARSSRTLILTFLEVSGLSGFEPWSHFGTMIMLIWSSQFMTLLNGGEQGSNFHELSLALLSVWQHVKYTQWSSYPGGCMFALFSSEKKWTTPLHCYKQFQWSSLRFACAFRIWLVAWIVDGLDFSTCPGQAPFQRGRNVLRADFSDQVHASHDYYITFVNKILVGYDYYFDTVDIIYYHEDFHGDSSKTKESHMPWDPGKSVLQHHIKLRLGDKPSFKEGGMLGPSPARISLGQCHGLAVMGLAQPKAIFGSSSTNTTRRYPRWIRNGGGGPSLPPGSNSLPPSCLFFLFSSINQISVSESSESSESPFGT